MLRRDSAPGAQRQVSYNAIMDPVVLGVVVFVIVTSALSIAIVFSIRGAREQGLAGGELLRRILPLLLVDGLFTVGWVVWLLGTL